MKNKNICSHNFGSFENSRKIKKLTLRNVSDLKIYLNMTKTVIFNAKVEGDIIEFDDGSKIEVKLLKE